MSQLYLPRTAEAKVLKRLEVFPAVAIVGPRQVGKTSLTQAIRNQVDRPSLYLDLEREVDLVKLADLEGLAERHLDHLLIFDEIQRMPELFPRLRSIIDRNRVPGRFLLLGSASPQLIKDSSESLAGRVAYLEMNGLSLAEIPTGIDFRTHWFRGGFPDALLATSEENSSLWREAFISSYLERELPRLGLDVNPRLIRRLWTLLGHSTGSQFNKSAAATILEVTSPTVSRYLDFLEQAYLIRRLQPYFSNTKKRLVKSPKVFIRDTGILHELLNIRSYETLLSHPILGASWEAYVIEQVSSILPRGCTMYHFRTAAGAEIDLIIEQGGVPKIAVEVKHSRNPKLSKGFHTSAEDLGVAHRFIIAPVEGHQRYNEQVRLLGIDALAQLSALL